MSQLTLDRITQDPAILDGTPCIRDTGITVSEVVSQIMAGKPIETLLAEVGVLDAEDVFQALVFAIQNLLDAIAWAKSEGLHPLNILLNAGYSLATSITNPDDKDIASLIAPNVEQTMTVLRQLNEWAKATYNAY
ncbi:MAG TPA: DUF433 domain-containing protein [Oceanobacillus sp.]|nr:DUF433 domain-containing protein [Oceanobacillus sp.]